uniref:Protein lifeguard 2 n=1 Tax=Takifugu rubripes TaxID=31033 RepID=A0A674MEN5_TAKRU
MKYLCLLAKAGTSDQDWFLQQSNLCGTNSSQLRRSHRRSAPFPLVYFTTFYSSVNSFQIFQIFCIPVRRNLPSCFLGTSAPCYNDVEMLTESSWNDCNIRRIFIRKVRAVTDGVSFSDPVKDYIQSNPGWYWASYAVFFITYLTLSCFTAPRRQFPWNLIMLAIFTLSLSYMTGMLSSFYNTKSVVLCLGITAAVCLLVTIFSFQTKFDVTSYQGVLFIFCMVLFLSGIMLALILPFKYVPWLDTLYATLGAILFTMFLAFDTQLLMGNKRYTISPEEYVFATLNIYLDIIYIFSFFLQIFGTRRE